MQDKKSMTSQLTFLPEWHKQTAIIMSWPHAHSDWLSLLNEIDPVFVNMAHAIALRQKLIINCFDDAHQKHITALLQSAQSNMQNIACHIVPTNDVWVRDYGPLSILKKNHLTLINFRFNAWGNKYNYADDDQVTHILQQQKAFEGLHVDNYPLVLEGGSLETDGFGTLLTTQSCLLAKTRNPHLSREQIEAELNRTLGIKRILWLKNGYLAGDDTDSHIDMLARLTDPHTICYVQCKDQNDEHYEALSLMEKELQNFKDYQGNPYRLIPLPFPSAQYNEAGDRLPASYANFLIINGAVLLPIYQDPADQEAMTCLEKCFPDRIILPIVANKLIHQYGSIHCATMQIASESSS